MATATRTRPPAPLEERSAVPNWLLVVNGEPGLEALLTGIRAAWAEGKAFTVDRLVCRPVPPRERGE